MKLHKIIYILFLLPFISGCEDPMDRTQIGVFGEEQIWASEQLLDLNIANLYARCEFYPGGSDSDGSHSELNTMVGIPSAGGYCRTFGPWPGGYVFTKGLLTNQGLGGAGLDYWKYDLVRDINEALEQLQDPENIIDDEVKSVRIGELYFLRAWVYFEMVKRYGGMPIIDHVQAISLPVEEMKVPRSSEAESYDFILANCDSANNRLAGVVQEYGRANEWAALALKSRAAMYAGSIGEFGEVQLDGILGIDNADKYWQVSYDASKKLIDEGGFSLYGMGSSNPEQDYYELFTYAVEDLQDGHPELIMAEYHDVAGGKVNDWERWCAPFMVGGTTFFNVFFETFEMYEYMDGTSGKIDRSELVEGKLHNMADFIGKKDPRCRANIFLPESQYMGQTLYLHEGTLIDGALVKEDNGELNIDFPVAGFPRDVDRTGLFNKKRSNDQYDVGSELLKGGTDYMIFRLGEIYLNFAEAAYALGKESEALDALNMIRSRVNMPAKKAIDWATIQNERAVELTFENHRYWDLRRWRIAEEVLPTSQSTYTGVGWRKDANNPGMYEIVHRTDDPATDPWERLFESHHYYFPITLARVQNNDALVENPGY